MKLFKKLAAAVLAAALALTMVGCGGNSYAMQNELLKITIDNLTDVGETVTHTKKADEMAAALLAAADTAAEQHRKGEPHYDRGEMKFAQVLYHSTHLM